ncbi:unnamed protein product [Durusdinium trenchii]|uniref:Uncharacterized protein n=1 Tax=Durusdinium trenchii TaxID=1381693 RepID=A0ABP0J8Z0_9DINO
MLAELVVCLSHRYCCKASSPFREVLMNLRVLILIIPACVLVSVLQLFVLRMELHRPLRSAFFAALMLVMAILWRFLKGHACAKGLAGRSVPSNAHMVGAPSNGLDDQEYPCSRVSL